MSLVGRVYADQTEHHSRTEKINKRNAEKVINASSFAYFSAKGGETLREIHGRDTLRKQTIGVAQ